jgi:hypothetical protein
LLGLFCVPINHSIAEQSAQSQYKPIAMLQGHGWGFNVLMAAVSTWYTVSDYVRLIENLGLILDTIWYGYLVWLHLFHLMKILKTMNYRLPDSRYYLKLLW